MKWFIPTTTSAEKKNLIDGITVHPCKETVVLLATNWHLCKYVNDDYDDDFSSC
jgi:hypothetical protein